MSAPEVVTPVEEVVSTTEKFDLLMKDVLTLVDTGKSLSARMKALSKEVSKLSKSKRKKPSTPTEETDGNKKVSALQKPVQISNELCSFLGFAPDTEHCRQEVTCAINKFIKDNNLQDPENRRFIMLKGSDAAQKLNNLLRQPDQPVTFFNIQRYLKPHYPLSEKEKKMLGTDTGSSVTPTSTKTDVVKDADVVVETAPVPAPPKKKVVKKTTVKKDA